MIDLIISILPFAAGAWFLFPGVFTRIFSKAKELNHNAVIQEETARRAALLEKMKQLGFNDSEDTAPEDLDKLTELLKQEFPILYQEKE
jgi:hypothetical protein